MINKDNSNRIRESGVVGGRTGVAPDYPRTNEAHSLCNVEK